MKNKKKLIIFSIITLFLITLIMFYIKINRIEHIIIKTNIINNTNSDIADFNIYIKYKSKSIDDINITNNKNILAHDKHQKEITIDDNNIFSIYIVYKNSKEGISYHSIENIKNIDIN